jgi:hypothetical protein
MGTLIAIVVLVCLVLGLWWLSRTHVVRSRFGSHRNTGSGSDASQHSGREGVARGGGGGAGGI